MGELILAALLLLAVAIALVVILSPKGPTTRPGATIVQETRGELDGLAEWYQYFLGTTPHVSDDRCAEAQRLIARIERLLMEYSTNPEKDQAVYENFQSEFDALKARVEQWCP
jgi:hypothetical protein